MKELTQSGDMPLDDAKKNSLKLAKPVMPANMQSKM
jgi:hypothetical protein